MALCDCSGVSFLELHSLGLQTLSVNIYFVVLLLAASCYLQHDNQISALVAGCNVVTQLMLAFIKAFVFLLSSRLMLHFLGDASSFTPPCLLLNGQCQCLLMDIPNCLVGTLNEGWLL
jgi:hypothetical protein